MAIKALTVAFLALLGTAAVVQAQMPYSPTDTAMAPLGGNMAKAERVARQIAAKQTAGVSFDTIASTLGVTNVYAANLLYGQTQLKPSMAAALKQLIPTLTNEDVAEMQKAPFHSFDPKILQEPALYRLYEAITHNGLAVKSLINEKFGDGIMSAIDFYFTVGKMIGTKGEDRVVITMNGKFLPYIVQLAADDVAKRAPNGTTGYGSTCSSA